MSKKLTFQEHLQDMCAYWEELGMQINNVDNTALSEKSEKAKEDFIAFVEKEIIGEDEEEPINVEHPHYEQYCEEVRLRNVLREEQREKLHA